MTTPFVPPSPVAVRAVRMEAERTLSPEEFERYVSAPLGEDEREHTLELIAWFTHRYPTPLERLRAARRAMQRARKRMAVDT